MLIRVESIAQSKIEFILLHMFNQVGQIGIILIVIQEMLWPMHMGYHLYLFIQMGIIVVLIVQNKEEFILFLIKMVYQQIGIIFKN